MAWMIDGPSLRPEHAPTFRWMDAAAGYSGRPSGPAELIDPAKMPTRAIATSQHDQLPDFFGIGGARVISGKFQDIIDRLEPQVHQVLPLTLYREGGGAFDGKHFILNVMQAIDAIIIEESNVEWIDHPPTMSPLLPGRILPGYRSLHLGRGWVRLVLSKEAIGGRHLWIGATHFQNAWFCSDEFLEAIAEARVGPVRVTSVETR